MSSQDSTGTFPVDGSRHDDWLSLHLRFLALGDVSSAVFDRLSLGGREPNKS